MHIESPYLRQEHAANFLNLSPRTLEKFRLAGKGPRFLKFGRRVMYTLEHLEQWAESQTRTSTADPGPSNATAV